MEAKTAQNNVNTIAHVSAARVWPAVKSFLTQDRSTLTGVLICCTVLLVSLLAPWLAPYDPEKSVGPSLVPPSLKYLLGTDNTGMDILSRILYAPKIVLVISLGSLLTAILLGVPLGLFSGYYAGVKGVRGLLSEGIMRLFDILQAFPIFVLAMILLSITKPSPVTIIFALSFINVPIYVRLVRSEVLQLRNRLYIDAARVNGNGETRLLLRHILPNAMDPVLAQASVTIGMSALLIAGLSFVGAGIAPPTPEWGSMIALGANDVIYGKWWPAIFPGLSLAITVYGFALLGEGVRKYVNPNQRSKRNNGK